MLGIKLLIFDLDDTLVNYGGEVTIKAWYSTCKMAKEELNLTIDDKLLAEEILKVNNALWTNEETRPKGNFIFKDVRRDTVKQALKNLDIRNPELVKYLVKVYGKCKDQYINVFSDVHSTLEELRKRGYKLALLTNGASYIQRDKIMRFNLDYLFDEIFIDGEIGVGKPEREAYFKVLDYFKVLPTEAAIIGNNYLHEVEAPTRLGLHTIWVNKHSSDKKEAEYLIKNISELLEILN